MESLNHALAYTSWCMDTSLPNLPLLRGFSCFRCTPCFQIAFFALLFVSLPREERDPKRWSFLPSIRGKFSKCRTSHDLVRARWAHNNTFVHHVPDSLPQAIARGDYVHVSWCHLDPFGCRACLRVCLPPDEDGNYTSVITRIPTILFVKDLDPQLWSSTDFCQPMWFFSIIV